MLGVKCRFSPEAQQCQINVRMAQYFTSFFTLSFLTYNTIYSFRRELHFTFFIFMHGVISLTYSSDAEGIRMHQEKVTFKRNSCLYSHFSGNEYLASSWLSSHGRAAERWGTSTKLPKQVLSSTLTSRRDGFQNISDYMSRGKFKTSLVSSISSFSPRFRM